MRKRLTSFIFILLAISLAFNFVAIAAVNDNVDLVVTPAKLERPGATVYTFPYNGQERSIGYVPPDGVIQTGGTGKATEIGTYKTFFKPDGNHVWTDGTRERVEIDLVIKAAFSNVPTAKTLTYDGTSQTLINAGTTSFGTPEYKLGVEGAYSTKLPSAKNAGTYVVYYKTSDVENSLTVTIAKREAELSWGTTSWTYDGSAHSTTCTVSNLASGDSCTVTLTNNSIKDVGSKTVTASSLSNGNYKLPAANTTALTVTKAAGSATAPTAETLTYNGADQVLINAGSSGTGTIQYKLGTSGTYGTALPKAKGAGSYDVYYKVVGDSGHSDVPEAKITVTIAKKEVGLTWGTKTWTYDGGEHSTTCTATGVVTGDTCTVTLANNSITDVGSKTVTASSLSNPNYKLPTANTATLTVTNAAGSVTKPTAKTLTYNGADQELINAGSSSTGTIQYKLGASGTYGTALPKAKAAGTYTVYYKVVANAGYNDVPEASLTVTIAQKEVGLTWGTTTWTYDGSTHQTTCDATGVITGDTCTVTLTNNSITNAGSKTVTASSLSNGNYKLPTANTATLAVIEISVAKAPGATYGFTLNSNGYYESTNKGVGYSVALARVTITVPNDTSVTVEVINSGETGIDFGVVGKIDTAQSTSATSMSNYWWKPTSTNSTTKVQTKTLTVPAGTHYIDFKYKKDVAVDEGNDSLQFKIYLTD